MYRIIPVICLLGLGPGFSQQACSEPAPAPTPSEKRADSLPPNGVIHPAPEASRDQTVRPPDVDPGMAIPPPGTPGGNPKVVPK
jgi:hypothetical protein